MWWRRVPKELAAPPASGSYSDWKELLAAEAHFKCVYCGISDSAFGGERNFHVEHYRPKSIFPALENDYYNLYYACAICNVLKGDDWPAEPDCSGATACYPEPAAVDFSDFFQVDSSTQVVSGLNAAGSYMTTRLGLNRVQLVMERRMNRVLRQARELEDESLRLLSLGLGAHIENKDALQGLIDVLKEVSTLTRSLSEARPYARADARRP